MKAEEYSERQVDVEPWQVKLTSYKLDDVYHCKADNVSPGAALARTTGGRHLSFLTLGSLENVISRAGEEIHSQYLLSFTPTPSAKDGFHQIQVAIPSHPDAVVRVRLGYWPQK